MENMSDSVKLRFEHGIWCLVLSYLLIIIIIVSGFLTFLVHELFFVLTFFSLLAFIFSIPFTLECFKEAINISKKEEQNKNIKRTMNKTLD